MWSENPSHQSLAIIRQPSGDKDPFAKILKRGSNLPIGIGKTRNCMASGATVVPKHRWGASRVASGEKFRDREALLPRLPKQSASDQACEGECDETWREE